jgi:molybdenum cofactor synthesis domain-containing protein
VTHTPLIPFDRALEIVLDDATPVARTEIVPVAAADGRVVAGDVTAESDVPPFHRAAMDGYAVVASDTIGARAGAPAHLRCLGTLHAGGATAIRVGRRECAAVSTGAPLPDGADAVVMIEETSREGDDVSVRSPVIPGQHVGLRAADLAAGNPVVHDGDTLSPARIGALAAAGLTTVRVYARPTLALLSTGDELVEPGHPLGPGQIYNVNRQTIAAIAARHGGVVAHSRLVGDSIDALDAALDAMTDADVLVISGGSSVGERDLVRDVLRARGDVKFHGIAVKPGKPTAYARLGGTATFGMPGNPTSCLSNGYLLLVPFLRKIGRLAPWEPRRVAAPLARGITSTPERHQFYTVRLANGLAEPAFKGSGEITSMADADGYIEIPVGVGAIDAKTVVQVTMF